MDENDNDPNYGSAHEQSNQNERTSLNDEQHSSSNNQNLHRKFAHHFSGRYFLALLAGFQSPDAVNYYKTMFPYCLSQNITTIDDAQMNTFQSEECHKNLLIGAFEYVENTYERNLAEKLSEKAYLDIELQEKNAEEYPRINDRIIELQSSLSSGLSAVLALIYKHKLYVACTGDTRAFLAKESFNSDGVSFLRPIPMTVVHSIDNSMELLRLSKQQIDINSVRVNKRFGNMKLTKCLGNFYLKKFYKQFPEFKETNSDLRIDWDPHLQDHSLDKECKFLILTSSSVIVLIENIIDKVGYDGGVVDSEDETITRKASRMLLDIIEKHSNNYHQMHMVADKTLQELLQIYRNTNGRESKHDELSLIIHDLRSEFGYVRKDNIRISEGFQQLNIDVNPEIVPVDNGLDSVDHHPYNDSIPERKDDDDEDGSEKNILHSTFELSSNEEIEPYVDFSCLLNDER